MIFLINQKILIKNIIVRALKDISCVSDWSPLFGNFLSEPILISLLVWIWNTYLSQYGHSQSKKKLGVGDKYHHSIKVHIGCPIIIWTGLNIKIGIVQKVYKWWSCSFAKMIPWVDNRFGKRTASSLIYFLNYVYFDI